MSLLARKKKLFAAGEPENNQMPVYSVGTAVTSTSALAITAPTRSAGDLLILIVATAHSGEQITTPSGWAVLDSLSTGAASDDTSLQMFTRSASNTTADNVTTSDSGQFQAGVIVGLNAPTSGYACEVDSLLSISTPASTIVNFIAPGATTVSRENTLFIGVVTNSTDSNSNQLSAFNAQGFTDATPGVKAQINTNSGDGGGLSVIVCGSAATGSISAPTGTLSTSSKQCRAAIYISEHR